SFFILPFCFQTSHDYSAFPYTTLFRSLTGVIGIRSTRGFVFTGAASVVHNFSDKLDLGAEMMGAVGHRFDLRRGQLQTEIGGNYKLRPHLSLDFGLITGYYQASPRIAPIVGFS